MKNIFCLLLAFFSATFALYSQSEIDSFQVDAFFPNWMNSSNYSANNILPFYFYHEQGYVIFDLADECESFSLFINNQKVKTNEIKPGRSRILNISSYTRDGINTFQISNVKPAGLKNAIRVRIPYPVLKKESLKKSKISADSIDLIEKIIQADVKHGFTSAQLAVIKDGCMVYNNAWGKICSFDENGKVTDSLPVSTETMYDLASVTKIFGANYGIQMLASEGKLNPDEKIVNILGEGFADDTLEIKFKNKERIPLEKIKEWKRKLTVRDVLTHTAGFASGYPYFNDNYDLASGAFNAGRGKNPLYSGFDGSAGTREETLRQIFRTPLTYEPHTKLVYSDVDFMILCFIVEKITSQRLDDYLREKFWIPLLLGHISYNPLENGFTKDDCAATSPDGNSCAGKLSFTGMRDSCIQAQVHDATAFHSMGGISGHAGLFSNAADLAKLAFLMLTGGYGERKFFTRNVIDFFISAQSVLHADYGAGWWRQGECQTPKHFGTLCSSNAFGHQGFSGTLVFVEPEENLVIIYLTNKINSPMVKGRELDNQFEGNAFQSSLVGFVPQIIMMGLKENTSRTMWKDFIGDMAAGARSNAQKASPDSKDDFRWQAYYSLKEVYDSL